MAARHEVLTKLRGMPRPLVPVYSTPRPNQPITLYEGQLEITQGGNSMEGIGTVQLEWLPFPDIRFVITSQLADIAASFSMEKPVVITAQTIHLCVQGDIDDSRSSWGREEGARIAGSLSQPVRQGSASGLRRLLIHLVNFRRFIGTPVARVTRKSVGSSSDRMVLEAGRWKVTLHAVRGFKELETALRAKRGYAITHIASVERTDGGCFSIRDVDEFLTGLNYFLSFARGFWSPGILRVGYDAGGKRVWSDWTAWRATPYRDVLSWTDKFHPEVLAAALPGFMAKWTDCKWREAIRLAIHWYVEANLNAGSLEGSIVSTQVALELLSWTYFVVNQQTAEFDREAAKNIRKFLVGLRIPTNVPSLLPNVKALSLDGPKTFVKVRNSIVHPNRGSSPFDPYKVREDAWRLGLWYLEMSLLSLFGFSGVYSNRLQSGGNAGEVEPVPWAKGSVATAQSRRPSAPHPRSG